VLELRNVSVDFKGADGWISAVDDVSFSIERGAIFGLVGESGCGKSTLALTVMGLLPQSARLRGSVRLDGVELGELNPEQRRQIRGNEVSFVPQDPRAALDPVTPVGHQVAEAIRAHRSVSRAEARSRAIEALTRTGIAHAASRYRDPPHRFSGGMCQRVVIAAALVNEPSLLVADEPTTALDVTIQAQILALLGELRDRSSMTVLLITHDMGVVAQTCDRVGVMYAGELVELGDVEDIFAEPRHPYTRALLGAIPASRRQSGPLNVIPGQVPDLADPPIGCRFKDRCEHRGEICETRPQLETIAPRHEVACFKHAEVMALHDLAGLLEARRA
jgi:oligopeptide/dipeptide ABC transporter ATP-binding protein